ncbi:MAG: SDR family NAD(P)-dependent oxidoreductase [Bacteroidia bacterium]|nr:SDR family NAD(P)-dependent oxidoreductase [Bacteroidia bacterium]
MNPDKKIALIAGASRGAGKGIALSLAHTFTDLILLGRSSRKDISPHPLGTIEDTADAIKEMGGNAISVKCDCSDANQVSEVLMKVREKFGKLDLLVNSAWGGNDMKTKFGSIEDTVEENWHYMFKKGVWNYLLLSSKAIPLLEKGNSPLITNVSFWDDDKYLGSFFYDLAKHSMNRMALGLGHELKEKGISVISLSPGYMKTEKVLAALEAQPELAEKFGLPTESTAYIGEAVKALYLDENKLDKSGQTLRVADLAKEYEFYDEDGSQPGPFLMPEAF